ncbi:MAG: 3,4-dihydroxy-2-butanone-4-phosphate synthase [Pseudooceanicola sp.]|jgi:3,4-dihydroxy 2-butanone 4-phosphate synthase/GTP cyclohydrolase II|nr:3,4-dihydroxy-2-butanone-4-phosphate synthase [Pseudooceanicola sp.]|tara:strand:+ start:1420 stop:2118 length:699 start_codon:yes stop_codon:yes gene_type:complete
MTNVETFPASDVIVGPQEILDCAAAGQMFVLVDDEDRENEGDLVIPADAVDAAAIAFMARHGCGLICLAVDPDIAARLDLRPMADDNQCENQTAFTVSIDAKRGTTTGISAAERANTIALAIDDRTGPQDFVSPGHMFPLVARPGGLLERTGHTEAAVDVARLAGRSPAGVICEIMNPDGTMARLDDLIAFARQHRLKIGRICDLVAFRKTSGRHPQSGLSTAPRMYRSGLG